MTKLPSLKVFGCLLLSTLAFAQGDRGAITGLITDKSGGAVPNVAIEVVNTATNARFETVSTGTGSYRLVGLPIGLYDLTAKAAGFNASVQRAVQIQTNQTATIDIGLNVGAVSESVTVQGGNPIIQTESADVSMVVEAKQFLDLPLTLGGGIRNASSFIKLSPGVSPTGTWTKSISGGGGFQDQVYYDGIALSRGDLSNDSEVNPSVDAIAEFKLITNNYSAEYAHAMGGITSFTMKSGTNQIHGTAFEFLRNEKMDARGFFPASRAPSKQNEWGATIGGPVVLPKIYNGKDKTFFFASYQATLLRVIPAEVQRIVPTTLQRSGNFSQIARGLRDPLANAPFPGNVIPANRINPVSRFIVDSALPDGGASGRISTIVSSPNNDHQLMLRGDHQFGNANRLSVRYYKSWSESTAFLNPKNVLEQTSGGQWFNNSISITDTHTISPTLVNQALFSINRTDGKFVPPQPEKSLASLGLKYYNDPIIKWDIDIAGYFRINTGDTNAFPRTEYQYLDTLRWTKGKHNLTFGGEYGRGSNDIINNFRANGQWSFNGAAPFTTDGLADFMLGSFNSLTQGIGEYKGTRFQRMGLFVQDSWKVTKRLTLDVGARWEPFFPFTDTLDKVAVWRPNEQSTRYRNAPKGVIYAGDPNVSRGTVPTTWGNLGPRVGFAWDVFGNGKTAVRGAYGVFFDSFNSIATNSQANQAPFGTVVSVFGSNANSFSDPWAGTTNPFPAPQNPPATATFPAFTTQFLNAADFRNPYIQSWNLTLEREIWGGFVTRASYAASKGTKLMVLRELNAAVFAPGATTATTNQRRPYGPAMGSSTIVEPVGNSTYHAFQLTAERRFSKGFTILANYQFSKSIDDTSANKGTGQVRTNPNNQAYDKALSDFNRPQVFNFSGLWELPIRFQNKTANFLIGGWNLNTILNLTSGQPFSVASGVDNARTGTGGQRVDYSGNAVIGGDRSRNDVVSEYLRRSVFSPNALGTFGTIGRNTYYGPGLANVDFGLAKNFRANDRLTTTFRFEAFNALNRVNLGNPVNAQNNGNFMRITGTNPPRVLQLALRLVF